MEFSRTEFIVSWKPTSRIHVKDQIHRAQSYIWEKTRHLLSGFLLLHKHHDQEASWGRKGLLSLCFHTALHHQRKSGLELKQSKKQELIQRPWRDVTYWLASPSLLNLPTYRTQDYHPRDGTTNKRPSSWSLMEKMPYSWISWRHFLKGGSFLCGNSSLCHTSWHTKPANTRFFLNPSIYLLR